MIQATEAAGLTAALAQSIKLKVADLTSLLQNATYRAALADDLTAAGIAHSYLLMAAIELSGIAGRMAARHKSTEQEHER